MKDSLMRTPKLINGMTEEKVTRAMLDYLAKKKTLKDIAKEAGVTERTISYWATFYELPKRLPKNKRHKAIWSVADQGELFRASDTLSRK